jgi:branched-chain amino acid transport system substrate-binding protein
MKKLFIVVMCFALILLSTSCASETNKTGGQIYIPILADASWLTSDGAFLNGVHLAEAELNNKYKDKGFKIKTSVIDDKASYETGVEMAMKVSEDSSVTAVFDLQNFDVTNTTAGILSGKGKLTLFPYGAYDNIFTQNNPYVFCGVPSESDLGTAMADYAVKKGYKRIAIYHNGTQAQEELVTAFELALKNTGSKVVDYVPSIDSENDFNTIYSRWKAIGVDCVVISQYGLDPAFQVLKMIRSKDPKIPIIGEPIFDRASALADNKAIAEGLVVPSTLDIKDTEQLRQFKELYKQTYGKEADIWAIQGYDMVGLIMNTAVKLDTNDPTKIAAALENSKGYQGLGRTISFAKGGALITDAKSLPMLICHDGKFNQGR